MQEIEKKTQSIRSSSECHLSVFEKLLIPWSTMRTILRQFFIWFGYKVKHFHATFGTVDSFIRTHCQHNPMSCFAPIAEYSVRIYVHPGLTMPTIHLHFFIWAYITIAFPVWVGYTAFYCPYHTIFVWFWMHSHSPSVFSWQCGHSAHFRVAK